MLKEFARYIRENHLEDFAQEERRLLRIFDVPLMRLFEHLSDDEMQRMIIASLERFLIDLEAGRALESAAENLRLWEADQLPGIPKDSIEPSDLVLVYTAQKEAMLRFLDGYTTEVKQAVRIVEEMEEHYRKVQDAAFQTFANLRAEMVERAARAKGEADAAHQFAEALQASNAELMAANEELSGQAEEMEAQQEELQGLYSAMQGQNERLEAMVAERTRELAKQASLLQLAQDAILVRDLDGGAIAFWNRGAEAMYGWRQEEALGRRLHELLKTEFPRPLPVLITELEQSGHWDGELVHTRKDGSHVVVASRWALQRDAQGRPEAILEINTNVTEQKRAEEQRRLFELLVKNVSDYAIYMLDPKGRVMSWNEGAQRVKGYREEEILGRHYSVFFKPEDVAAGRPERLLALAEKDGHEEDEGWRVRKDGSLFWADAVITAIYENQTLIGFAKVTRDLSDRKMAEEALLERNEELQAANEELNSQAEELQAQQEELHQQANELARQRMFHENLVRNIPVAIAFLDNDLVYRWVNPAWEQAAERPSEQVVGRRLSEAFPDAQAHATRLETVLKTGEMSRFSAISTAFKSGTYWDVVYVPMIVGDQGKVDGIITVALDVTDRVERELLQRERIETMERVDTLKDQFLSILSHELRTPINAIMGFGSILEDGLAGPLGPEQAKFLRKMLGGAETLLSLVNDLLDMSRIQAGKFALDPTCIYFQDLAADVIANLLPLAEQKRQVLVSEIPPDLPDLMADKQRVTQILVNLVSNAIKFTDQGGSVTVRARVEGNQLRCEVQDTGIGIAAEHQSKLFQRFSQVDTSNTRTTSGTGLGLSIVKALVEAHGGAVGVRSAPGEGSTFWFTLPLGQASSG